MSCPGRFVVEPGQVYEYFDERERDRDRDLRSRTDVPGPWVGSTRGARPLTENPCDPKLLIFIKCNKYVFFKMLINIYWG